MLEVVKVLWPSLDETDFIIAEYSAFLNYVEAEIRLLHRPTSHATGVLKTAMRIFPSLQAHRAKTRDGIIQIIQKDFLNADHTYLLQCTELAVRIWLTLNIRS